MVFNVAFTNRVKNPSFESGTTGWAATGGTLARATSGKIGSYSLSFTRSASGTAEISTLNDSAYRMPVTSGPVSAGFSIKSAVSSWVSLTLYFLTSTGTAISNKMEWAVHAPADTWVDTVKSFEAPATAAYAYLKIGWSTPPDANTTSYVDAVFLGCPQYFDGSTGTVTIDGTTYATRWTGTANASTSEAGTDTVSDTTVTPTAPTATDTTCSGGTQVAPSLRLPTTTGVSYTRSPAPVAGGNTTVTATANNGYIFPASVTGWVITTDRKTATRTYSWANPTCATVDPTASMSIQRSVDGGQTWEIVAENLPPQTLEIEDYQGLSAGETLYRLTAYTALKAEAVNQVNIVSESQAFWLAVGDDYSLIARLPANAGGPPPLGNTPQRERSSEEYEGRTWGVPYAGTTLRQEVTTSGVLVEGNPDFAGWRTLEQIAFASQPIHLLRTPLGQRVYGKLGEVPLNRTRKDQVDYQISVSRTESPIMAVSL